MALASPGHAQEEEEPRGPFDRGRWTMSLALGSQQSFDDTYFVVGGGVGYYVVPGLLIGAQGAHWFGGSPSVSLIEPNVRYVLHQIDFAAKPYVGAFYRHWFVGSSFEDVDTLGGRAGVLWLSGSVIIGLGARYEQELDCLEECSTIAPELTVSLSF